MDLETKNADRVVEVAKVFTRLGFTAFGGPAVHIGMMEDAVVTRRRWLDRQHFLDLVASINFIPGPNSTELAISLGWIRAGFAGLVVAGVCFIAPAVLIILPLAWVYVTFNKTPQLQPVFQSVSAAVLAIVVVALWRFAKTGLITHFGQVIAVAAVAMQLLMLHFTPQVAPEIPVLAAAAIAGILKTNKLRLHRLPILSVAPLSAFFTNTELWRMAATFLKIGATLFGSGYVLISYLQSGFVDSHGWLTRQQVLDAIAIGQFTPGPVLTTATFIGYLLGAARFNGGVTGGIAGAVIATVAIFLPSFIFTAVLGGTLNRIRQSPRARGALDAMNAAVVALITVTAFRLATTTLSSPTNIAIAVLGTTMLLIWNINSTWLILGAVVIRLILLHGN